jgi:hypothetical protein
LTALFAVNPGDASIRNLPQRRLHRILQLIIRPNPFRVD